MIEEIRVFGVYMPAALCWAALALAATAILRRPLLRYAFGRLLWHPALLELATFFLLWWGIAHLADFCFPRGLLS
jgi:hypothetical protein